MGDRQRMREAMEFIRRFVNEKLNPDDDVKKFVTKTETIIQFLAHEVNDQGGEEGHERRLEIKKQLRKELWNAINRKKRQLKLQKRKSLEKLEEVV